MLNYPAALTIDLCGFILVGCNHHVSVFDKDGVFIHSFGSKGSAEGQFLQPRGVAVSSNNDVFVVDFDNKRVQIF